MRDARKGFSTRASAAGGPVRAAALSPMQCPVHPHGRPMRNATPRCCRQGPMHTPVGPAPHSALSAHVSDACKVQGPSWGHADSQYRPLWNAGRRAVNAGQGDTAGGDVASMCALAPPHAEMISVPGAKRSTHVPVFVYCAQARCTSIRLPPCTTPDIPAAQRNTN